MKFSKKIKIFLFISLLFFINSCITREPFIQGEKTSLKFDEKKPSLVQKISYTEKGNYTRILIEGTEEIETPLYKLVENPLRIIIDVPNIDFSQIKEPLRINNGLIGEVTSTQYDDKGRIEISLARVTNYNILKDNKNLIIDIENIIETKKEDLKEEKKQEIEKKEELVKGEKETEAKEEIKKAETEPIKESKVVEQKEEVKEKELKETSFVETKNIENKIMEENKINEGGIQPKAKEITSKVDTNKAKEVFDFILEQNKDFITFNILADGMIENYNYFKLESPPRLVLDILNVETRYPKKIFKAKNPFIKEVRIGKHNDKLRLVFDFLKPKIPSFQVNRINERIIVSIGNVPQPSEPQVLLQKGQGELETSLLKVAQDSKQLASSQTKKGRKNILRSIDFKEMNNKQRIIIGLEEEPEYESKIITKNIIDIDIKNAFGPKHLLRGLDTSEFGGAVKYIDIKNIKIGKDNNIRISVKLKEEVPYEISKEGNIIFIDVEKPKSLLVKHTLPPISEKKEPAEEVPKEEIKKEEKVQVIEKKKEEPLAPAVEAEKTKEVEKKIDEKKVEVKKLIEEPVQEKEKVYTGRKMSLDFKDADIKNILRLIAEVSNLNIIAGDDVTGKITMRLIDVPWDQALDVILQARNLGMTRVGNVIRVAPMETLKREVQAELEAKRAKERLEDLVTELIPVNYASAKEIAAQAKSVLSERGDVKVDERTNTLIVKDIPKNIPAVKNLVKSLDTKTPQVLIEARIVEANLTFQEELGVKWGFLAVKGEGEKKTAYVGGGTAGSTSISGSATSTDLVVNLPAVAQGGVPGTTGSPGILELLFTSQYGLRQLDIAISAHENKGDVKVISSPKIATLNNREASIEQGLRIPYRKLTTEGTVTTDFIDANLKLTVIPHVTNDGNIKMTIKAKKDAPDTSITVDGVPSIDKKEAITEVLVKDNGVIVIAGVYSIEKNENVEGVPLFSKIPLLGWLFKRETKQDKRKDLLIFISPKIIKDQV